MMKQDSTLQSPDVRHTYEVIERVSTYILVVYKDDFVLGSFALNSESELDEWIAKMQTLEITKRES
jgi:hypothetical protein